MQIRTAALRVPVGSCLGCGGAELFIAAGYEHQRLCMCVRLWHMWTDTAFQRDKVRLASERH